MGKVLITGGGGAGGMSDDMTAANGVTADLVPKGQTYIGADTDDEIGTGTMDLAEHANANPAHVLNGEKFYNNNSQLPASPAVGTMPNIGALDTTTKARLNGNNLVLGMTNGAHITNGGNGTLGTPEVQISFTEMAKNTAISGQLNPANIKKGATVFGKTGTFTGVGNAAQANVLAGKTFSNNTQMGVAGTMPNVANIEQRKSYSVSGGNLYLRMTNGAHVTNASGGYPEVYIPQADVAKAFGVTADKIAYGQSIMGVKGTNYNGQQISSASPFAGGKFGDGVSLSNFNVWSWGSSGGGGSSGSDSVSFKNNDHLQVRFKNYEYDKSLGHSYGEVFAYNKLLTFSTIKKISMTFTYEPNPEDPYGQPSAYVGQVEFCLGTTNGGRQIAHGYSTRTNANMTIGNTTISSSIKSGQMVTMTYDISSITQNGYLSIVFSYGNSDGGDSDSFNWSYSNLWDIYSLTFS